MSLYFYSYQGYIGGVKATCEHNVRELNDNPENASKEAIQIIKDSNDDQSMDVHLLALNKFKAKTMTARTKTYIYLTIAAWSLAYLTTYPQFTELLVKAIT